MPVRQRTLAPALRLAQVQVWGYVGCVISDKLYFIVYPEIASVVMSHQYGSLYRFCIGRSFNSKILHVPVVGRQFLHYTG